MRKNEVFGQSGGGYNLNGGTVAKIRFGLNNGASREWAICGAEDGNLVLLSITAFDTIQYGETSKYSKSNFVNNIDTYLGKTYFSASELGKMVTVDVGTLEYDQDEDDDPIKVTSKLYLSDAASRESSNYSETSIYVGTENDIEIMLENIISTNGFSAGEGEFWLRTSKSTSSMHVQLAWFGRSVNTKDIGEYAPVLPALHLDLSSVLFASAAEAASSSSSKNTPNSAMTENTYTLRYESTGSETATISTDGMSVTVVNAEMNYHLMVQNGEGVYELLIEDDSQVIRASEIKIGSSSLENFDNCKVWVESTDADRITTAKLATTATDDSTGTTGATGTTGTTGTTDTTDTTTTYVPAAWVPTDPADIYRYSLLGPEAPFYKVLSSVDSIQMVKEIQGPLFFDAVELIQGDYKLARTYNIFVNNTLTYDNGNSVKIELQIPQDLQKEGRTFRMFGVTEDGKNFVLEDLDTDPTTITFAANRFYAFALGYID